MNVVLLVVDSLRACSLGLPEERGPRTPFLDRLGSVTTQFRRAYASECWTLPAHCSMFTGLLPSQHRAHFQTMAYNEPAPTAAEALSVAGYETEIITRNSIFDGTIPGITRGFRINTRLMAGAGRRLDPLTLLTSLAKPRVRRLIAKSGFFGALQRQNRQFVSTLARMGMPADRLVLDHALERMALHRRRQQPYFLFLNLYDVHARTVRRRTRRWRVSQAARLHREPHAAVGPAARQRHAYLRPGFHLSERSGNAARPLPPGHRADGREAANFYDTARGVGLLDDTLLIVTSDHGEAFGEHGLYSTTRRCTTPTCACRSGFIIRSAHRARSMTLSARARCTI
jgi:arylsulfatase A-like enzyme